MSSDFRFIVIGGSAGSLQPVLSIFSSLTSSFPIPILLVVHRNPAHASPLEELLRLKTKLIVREVEEKDKVQPGFLYICPPDYHVLLENDNTFSLDDSEKVNFSRPSIDVVFASASTVFKQSLMGILLSGANADGTNGLKAIKSLGGKTVVQDPEEAEVPFMPRHGIKWTQPDYILRTNEIAGLVNSLVI